MKGAKQDGLKLKRETTAQVQAEEIAVKGGKNFGNDRALGWTGMGWGRSSQALSKPSALGTPKSNRSSFAGKTFVWRVRPQPIS